MPRKKWPQVLAATLLAALLSGCGHLLAVDTRNPPRAYAPSRAGESLAARFQPVFLVQNERPENSIGRVKAEREPGGGERLYVDPKDPAVYFEETSFSGARGRYTNLVYRVHFPNTPYSLVPFILTARKNVGIMVIVTLNEKSRPVLVTTVHTCGCYAAVVPTTELPRDCLPEGFREGPIRVYGERLPGMLDFSGKGSPRVLVVLRPGVHRVMDLKVIDGEAPEAARRIDAPLVPAGELWRVPFPGGGTTSFFHEGGLLRGHVKGSVKPWETILMSWMALDLFVGADKAFDTARTKNPFYTSLKPWNRHASDLWDFPAFLAFHGFRL